MFNRFVASKQLNVHKEKLMKSKQAACIGRKPDEGRTAVG